ncbi:MAG: protein kinase, partial [Bacteroidetes bacterium]|nr:protein kinase [Bacteroidota bacterium]
QKARKHGKWIIIKRIKPEYRNNHKYRELFFQEFENAYHLDHPHVIKLLDKGEDAQGPYYTMEYVDGRPLSKMIVPGGIKDERLVRKILMQTLDALSYVHKKQVIHRDLKPANILITYKGDNVKLLDFGLAAADSFDDDLAKAGTPKYAAPEQMDKSREVDQRADIYSIGLILKEMLTGDLSSRDGKGVSDPTYAAVIDKCVQQNPANRFNNCEEIIEFLNKGVQGAASPLAEADRLFSEGKYAAALPLYMQCLQQNPSDEYVKSRINSCNEHIQKMQGQPAEKKKSKAWIFIVIAAVTVILLVILFFLFKDKIFGTDEPEPIISDTVENVINLPDVDVPDNNIQDTVINTPIIEDLKNDPNVRKADSLFEKDDFVNAKELYEEAQKEHPDNEYLKEQIKQCDENIGKTNWKGLKPVKGSNGKYGYENSDGQVVISHQYDEARWFNDGLAAVKKDGLWVFIDMKGKTAIDHQYTKVEQVFSPGYNAFVVKDGKCWVIDKKGNILKRCP